MKYVVVKASRRGSNRTYTGPSWEAAGMVPPTTASGMERDGLYLYDNQAVADDHARTLSSVNPVGFVVEEYKEENETISN